MFNPHSPTFTEGRIGAWREQLGPRVKDKLQTLGTDYLEAYGYADETATLPVRAAEFRRRALTLPTEDFSGTPIALDTGFLRHTVVRYAGRYHVVPEVLGPVDLTKERPFGVKVARTLHEAQVAILRRRLRLGLLWRPWMRLLGWLRR